MVPRASKPETRTLGLNAKTRRRLWRGVAAELERYYADLNDLPIAPTCEPRHVRERLASLNPDVPLAPEVAFGLVVDCLRTEQLHAAHPRYFGLFVPAPSAMGVIAEALAAGFNPQLASWSHSPFGVEAEQWVVRALASRLRYGSGQVEGTITTGGSEANLTALLVALHHAWPNAVRDGIRSLPKRPCVYLSIEAHDSWRKAVRVAGLGEASLRYIRCDDAFRLDVGALARRVAEDRRCGLAPFLVVGTVGSTASGAIDPMHAMADLARSEGVWLHADAAWGGAAALSTRHCGVVAGLAEADSLTLDPHKWMSSPMGAGVYLSGTPGLRAVFQTHPAYLPSISHGVVPEPFQESLQWSRRFGGLKVLLTLITAGWSGLAAAIDFNFELGARLERELVVQGWRVLNQTPLPVVCFDDPAGTGSEVTQLQALVDRVNGHGRCWVSLALLGGVRPAIRACVANYGTTHQDIDLLLGELNSAREYAGARGG